jgi:hypothetical protein
MKLEIRKTASSLANRAKSKVKTLLTRKTVGSEKAFRDEFSRRNPGQNPQHIIDRLTGRR